MKTPPPPDTHLIPCQQGSPEWHAARVGVCTASRFSDAVDRLKSGAASAKCLSYAAELAYERLTRSPAPCYETRAMKRGHDLEPEARAAYEEQTGHMVLESGVVISGCGRFGYSTDGLVGDDGLIEIKCPESAAVLVRLWTTKDPADYIHQIQGGLWLTGRSWCDLVIFCPLMPPGLQLLIIRITRDEAQIAEMAAALESFVQSVEQLQIKAMGNLK